MEQPQINEKNQIEATQINIPKQSINDLLETGKWTKFLSILGFVFVGLMVILSFFIGTLLSGIAGEESALPIPGFMMGFLYLLLAGIYFFPILYLFKFSTNIKKALTTNDYEGFNLAISNLKSHYKFVGILTIIMLALYFFIFVGTGLVAIIAS